MSKLRKLVERPFGPMTKERVDGALQRIKDGHACMRVPAEGTDPDIVIAELWNELSAALQAEGERQCPTCGGGRTKGTFCSDGFHVAPPAAEWPASFEPQTEKHFTQPPAAEIEPDEQLAATFKAVMKPAPPEDAGGESDLREQLIVHLQNWADSDPPEKGESEPFAAVVDASLPIIRRHVEQAVAAARLDCEKLWREALYSSGLPMKYINSVHQSLIDIGKRRAELEKGQ